MPDRSILRALGAVSRLGLVAALSVLAPVDGVTQSITPPDTSGGSHGRFFTGQDAAVAGLFAVGTIAMFPLDRTIAANMKNSSLQNNAFVHHTADAFRVTAVPGSALIGGGLYAVGRLTHSSRLAELGLHGTEALLVGQAFGSLIKGTVGRARPYQVADSNAHDFEFLRGFRKGNDYSSLPSGHTIAAFAAAAAVTAETSRWWPHSGAYIGTVLYGGAAMVGLERLYNDKHWASDVILAAGIGTFSGLKVVKYNHENPNNRLDRVLLSSSIAPGPDGRMALSFTLTP